MSGWIGVGELAVSGWIGVDGLTVSGWVDDEWMDRGG